MPALAILGAAGIQGGASLAGGKKGASAATQASQLQFQAAIANLQQQQQIRQQNVAALQPFVDYGTGGINTLQSALPALTTPIDTTLPTFNEQFTFQPTAAQLEQFPGYQFIRDQSLKAGQNALTATGLGRSMGAVTTAENIGTNLALSASEQPMFSQALQGYQTRQQTFLNNTQNLLAGRTMDLQQRQQILNMLAGRVQTGLSAGGALAGANLQSGQAVGSAITGAGAAQASGVVGAANAQIGGLQGIGNAAGGAAGNIALINALGGGGGFNLFGSGVNPEVAMIPGTTTPLTGSTGFQNF